MCAAHGLSLYVELVCGRKVLVDMGPDDGFIENAKALGIDLSQVDTAVLSHAHRDHTGGLEAFLQLNQKAKVYLRKGSFGRAYHISPQNQEYIGPDESLQGNSRLVETDEEYDLGDGMRLFSGIRGKECLSEANGVLFDKTETGFVPDPFLHEQGLLIREGENLCLFGGCAHTGILNQLSRAAELEDAPVTHVVSGFHLNNPRTSVPVSDEVLDRLAGRLLAAKIQCYTCHCTGIYAFERLREKMGKAMAYLACGDEIQIG